MTSNSDELDRVRNIVPSARRSIHSQSINSSRKQNMGKYGLKGELNLSEPGVDEVDNIMSKILTTKSSPILAENKSRRYSYHVSEETDDDDYDEMGFDTAIENMSGRSINSDSSSINYNLIDTSPSRQNNMNRKPSPDFNRKKKGFNAVIYIVLPVIVCAGSLMLYNMRASRESEMDVYDKQSFYNDVKHLGIKYKVPDNAILKVRAGITTIFERHDTGSFIFTYNSEDINYNPIKFDQFIEDIAAKASKYLRNNTREIHHLVINPTNLIVQTEKEFMNLYQKDVDERGVMLIKDVDNIPSHLAMAFHYYCDEYNPLVKKSAIFLTLNLAKCSNGSESKSTHDYIEKCLARKWNTIDKDKLGPLLTRVVNIVIDATRIL
ncbi:uncharacterized protein LOC116767763 isoform X2 [Danaus plexippus]|uniref:uncharacterized protein LOC116767763 isoform X2 n=1 Tax=Danaus plexippus TaxID=13037 RepID=UPI002AAF23E1|nr:uncharacterized protein LOC116767763 isoform X2 [Danaus plexippus]